MIIALFALSIAMIVGGIASVVQGFPFVRLESGLAMTIAGAATASAGAVLLGLAVVAGQVRNLGRRLAETSTLAAAPRHLAPDPLPQGLKRQDLGPAEAALQASRRPPIAGAAGLAAVGAGAIGAGAIGAGAIAAASVRERPEPPFEEPPPSAAEPMLPDLLPDLPPHPLPALDEHRMAAPDVSHHAETEGAEENLPQPSSPVIAAGEPEAAKPEREESETDLFAATEPEAPALRPAIEDVTPPSEAPEPQPAEPSLEVVGTYVSGGNTYVMFSDGSIEAETPRGRFTFESLEELKAFVEAGGEGETRGVA